MKVENAGKRFTWDELVDQYPDQWVILDQPEMDGADVESGILIEVCNDDEIEKQFIMYMKNGKSYLKERTTDVLGFQGVFNSANFDYYVK